MGNNYNYSGELFLDTLFKDLYKSKEVLNGKIHLNDFVNKEEFNLKTK